MSINLGPEWVILVLGEDDVQFLDAEIYGGFDSAELATYHARVSFTDRDYIVMPLTDPNTIKDPQHG